MNFFSLFLWEFFSQFYPKYLKIARKIYTNKSTTWIVWTLFRLHNEIHFKFYSKVFNSDILCPLIDIFDNLEQNWAVGITFEIGNDSDLALLKVQSAKKNCSILKNFEVGVTLKFTRIYFFQCFVLFAEADRCDHFKNLFPKSCCSVLLKVRKNDLLYDFISRASLNLPKSQCNT